MPPGGFGGHRPRYEPRSDNPPVERAMPAGAPDQPTNEE